MKYINLIIFLFVFSLLSACKPGAEENDKLKLWYEQPASSWVEALPIGNGRLGAMIYGGESTDHIQFNEETLWTGRPHDYSHEGASEYLGTIRKLLWEGKQKEAEKLALEKFMSVPLHQEKYQPFGDLWLEFANHDSITEFRRELDIANAICRTTYMTGGKKYTREYFASHPANLIVIRLLSDNRRSLSFDLKMTALHEDFKVTPGENNTLTLAVKVKNGVLYGSSTARVL